MAETTYTELKTGDIYISCVLLPNKLSKSLEKTGQAVVYSDFYAPTGKVCGVCGNCYYNPICGEFR